MEVLVRYEGGTRFSATRSDHEVTTGKGEDGDKSRDGMWPAQLLEAAAGMCIGGYVAKFCRDNDIPCEDLTLELSRRLGPSSEETESGSRPSVTKRIKADIRLDAALTPEQEKGLLEAADNCHITRSLREGMGILCSLADGEGE